MVFRHGLVFSSRCRRPWVVRLAALALALAAPGALSAQEFRFAFGGDAGLVRDLEAASGLYPLRDRRGTAPQDLLAAARAEYGRLLGALYARGYYGAVIEVRLDGREAAAIPPLDAPARIGRVELRVDPGPPFVFGRTGIAPLARDTVLPDGFSRGAVAASGLITDAATAATDRWRETGHAKARIAGQEITAVHPGRRLDVQLAVDPGPRLRFGRLTFQGQQRMREERLQAIAGLPTGEIFDPRELRRVAERLRRTGVFASVALAEGEAVTPPDFLDIGATVVEEKRRRYTFGLEVSSLDGAAVAASWLHRNLFGGAERLRIDGEVAQIGAQDSGMDYSLGIGLERPATFTADTTAAVNARIRRLEEADYTADELTIGGTLTHYLTDRLTLSAGLALTASEVEDATGDYSYRALSLPLGATFENRDTPLDAKDGEYVRVELRPFAGFDGTESGLRLTGDARLYRSPGQADRVTLALRGQLGYITGPSLLGTPRTDLFFAGGGGTVRGLGYQDLGIAVAPDVTIGGQAFLGLSAEARVRLGDRIGVVAFADWASIGATGFFDDAGREGAGAGLGLRYETGVGPVRLDIAAPIAGGDGGAQVYIGIGQAF